MKSFFDRIFGKKDPKETPSPPASSSREEPSKAVEIEQEKISVPSESMPKPPIISEIEKIIGKELYAAPANIDDTRGWAIPFSRKKVKYLWEEGNLIVLNLAGIALNDSQWKQILALPKLNLGRLEALNLFQNQLTEIRLTPEMRKLEWINVEGNPLEFPAEEITKQGNEAILRFLKQILSQGERELYEVKLLIVGEGGTGKTTLWHKLQDMDHPVPLSKEEQPVTVGISIKEGWCFDHLEDSEKDFLVNLWDFGGQEIQYMTHQFFLTPRSFYILMTDGRREVGNFPYWLKIINLLGRDPKQEEPTPVLVIVNKRGNPTPAIPYDPHKVRKQYPKLELIRYDVDFAVRDFELKQLPEKIQDLLCTRVPHLPLRIPALWEEVRMTLKRLKDEGKNHISFDDFKQVCGAHKITKELQMEDLSRTLHELGVILHYQDEDSFALRNFVVLNPHWAVKAVYEILNHKEVEENHGRFNKRFLADVWSKKKYTLDEQSRLLEMMSKDNFEICFKAREKGREIYIAPQLLPDDPPSGFEWDSGTRPLQYIYQYPFIPKGLIGRLIVRLNEYIYSNQETKVLWKKGVLLKYKNSHSKQEAEALIEETTAQRTGGEIIHVRVKAEEPQERHFLLGLIREEFHKLHEEVFPNLEFYELVPCICSECLEAQENSDEPYFFPLEGLYRRKDKGINQITCDNSLEDVPIQLLLDIIFAEKGVTKETEHVRNLIAKGFLGEAVEELKKIAPESLRDEAIQLQGWYKDLERKIIGGILKEGSLEEQTQRNTIRSAALSFCSKIESRHSQ